MKSVDCESCRTGLTRNPALLVDNGNSTNLIFLSAYNGLGLEKNVLVRKIRPLIGFNGEIKQTVEKVMLPVYAEEVNKYTKFLVIDCASSYNMIMGRLWIQDPGAVPSTLLQVVKFFIPRESRK